MKDFSERQIDFDKEFERTKRQVAMAQRMTVVFAALIICGGIYAIYRILLFFGIF